MRKYDLDVYKFVVTDGLAQAGTNIIQNKINYH